MVADSQRPNGRDGVIPSLNMAIEDLNIAKEESSVTPAKAVFRSTSFLITMIRDSMANKAEYVELGLACADVCRVLDQGTNGKQLDDLSQPVNDAINRLAITVAEIQTKAIKQSGRNAVSRFFRAKNHQEKIATWRSDLDRILNLLNTELPITNTQTDLSDIRHAVAESQGTVGKNYLTRTSTPGEFPPPPPRTCFGRDELIEKIVGLADDLTPIALIGPAGIGKTSIALTVLHHDRVKERFGDNRRFIRCDKFPTSRAHFLNRLSGVIGAEVESSEDLTPLRPFLSSGDMIIFLDNAESVLDTEGTGAREVYPIVEELSQFKNICLCITSRVSTAPRHCRRLTIPTLSMESACNIFYDIYDNGGRSDIVNNLLIQLDFHALSITLLATTASYNMWDYDRLSQEWDTHGVQLLQVGHNESLAATIELSLASPMFHELGPDARDLLSVVAFFPQGINENNLNWLSPTYSIPRAPLDIFCVLSLTHRSDGFVTMLAPLRKYIYPKNPALSSLLQATKEHYFRQLLVDVNPDEPGFGMARWIESEGANVKHLLDIFVKNDQGEIAAWGPALGKILELFDAEFPKNTHVAVSDITRGVPNTHYIITPSVHQNVSTQAIAPNPQSDNTDDFEVHRIMVENLERTDNKNRSTGVTREPVYGPGHFASSQISLTTAAADESDTFDEYCLDIIPPSRPSSSIFDSFEIHGVTASLYAMLSAEDAHHGPLPEIMSEPVEEPFALDSEPPPGFVPFVPSPPHVRLIRRAFSPHELISLIEEIFMRKDEINTIGRLGRPAAQTFIDVVHEVGPVVLHLWRILFTPILFGSIAFGLSLLINQALDAPDLPSLLRKKCLITLCWICGRHALLPKSLQIPLCYDRLDTPLYCGGFGDVWKGEHQGRHVAVKVLRVYSTSDFDKITSRFCKEVVTWNALRHPNVLQLLGVTMGTHHFAMASEWMVNGNINEFIKAHRDVNRLELLEDVARGLVYMHSQAMIHGDLKGANILIDQNCHARLADFGLLTIISDTTIATSSSYVKGGTTRWMSPELLNPDLFGFTDSRPTKESDCYALGMVVLEILSGRPPLASDKDFIVIQKIIAGERPGRPEGPEGAWFTSDLWGMLQLCWAARPESRPNVEMALECLERVSRAWEPPSQEVDGDVGTDEDDLDDRIDLLHQALDSL